MPVFSFSSWFRRVKRQPSPKNVPNGPQRRPNIEGLEDRLPPGDLFGLMAPDPFDFLTARTGPAGPASPPLAAPGTINYPAVIPAQMPTVSLLNMPAAGSTGGVRPSTSSQAPPAAPTVPDLPTILNNLGAGSPNSSPFAPTQGGGGSGTPTPPGGGSGAPGSGDNPTAQPPKGGVPMVTDVRNGSGQSVASGYTNDTRPTVEGTAGANQTLQLLLNGQVTATVTANGEGKWSHRLTSALPEGAQSFTARPAGGSGTPTGAVSTTIDITPPNVLLEANEFVGSRDVAWVRVTATDNFALAATYSIDVDLNGNGTFTDAGEKDFATSTAPEFVLQGLEEGTYQLQARVSDRAGNEGASSLATMQVDPYAGYLGSQVLRTLAGLGPVNGPRPAPGAPTGSTPMPGDQSGLDPSVKDGLMFDSQGRLFIQARATLNKYLAGFKADLEELGMKVSHVTPRSNMVTGYLPIAKLADLEQVEHFSAATHVPKPFLRSGSVQSEGDRVMLADSFRASQGVDGSGINIGVLSDSVDQFAGGLSDSQSTGDLPNNVTVLADGSSGDSDEGRAMMEHIYDIAPGSGLLFHTAFNGEDDFAQGIRDLAAAGAQVITDDVGYLRQPIFSAGRVGQAVDEVVFDQNVVYTTAAGNAGSVGWRGAWSGTSATIGSVSGTFMDFGGGDVFQDFTLATGDNFALQFAWDEAYLEGGDPGANFQVQLDLAVHIINRDNNTIITTIDDDNPNVDQACEFDFFTNNSGTSNLAFAFQLKSSSGAPTRIAWMTPFSDATLNAEGEGSSTMLGHTVAAGAISTGAADVMDTSVPEDFSSFGGNLEIFFSDRDGSRFATPEIRQKPEVTGPDGALNTFFGSFNRFFGTSAAAPHVAAAAALLLQQSGVTDPTLVKDHLMFTALDLGTPGFDDQSGFGLVQLAPLTPPAPDALESNNTSDASFTLGALTGSTTITDLSILPTLTGLPDYDWITFTAGSSGTASVSISPQRRLQVQLFTSNAGFLTPVGTSTPVTAGQQLYVEIKGATPSSIGKYSLTITIA